MRMGLFDGIAKAFANEDFKAQDQRVRASHILLKGDDIEASMDKVKALLETIGSVEEDNLVPTFAELARSNS